MAMTLCRSTTYRADGGNDGYLESEQRLFAVRCFQTGAEPEARRSQQEKGNGDLGKAIALNQAQLWTITSTFISNYEIPSTSGETWLPWEATPASTSLGGTPRTLPMHFSVTPPAARVSRASGQRDNREAG
jgi:hypothetical protein